MTHILTVDDSTDALVTVTRSLSKEGYTVVTAENAETAQRQISRQRPDLIILDVMMPGKDGLSLCRELRSDSRYNDVLILFLTGADSTADIVAGLDAGGDDYLVKPFEAAELKARVRALVRRIPANQHESVLTVAGVTLDSDTFQVTNRDHTVRLTATEHRLLRFIMEHPGQAMSTQKLLEQVWDYPPRTGDPDLVRAHIRNLRQKIEPDESRREEFIATIHGVGYMVQG